ncbi:MAG: hypothetical protein R3F14_14195 [Polyangiaceae bacterium]
MTGALVLSAFLAGCGGAETTETDPGPSGHALKLDVSFKDKGGEVAFLTPSNTVVTRPASELAGKPYLIATFEAGFSSGNDAPIDHVWGTIPDSLAVSYSTPATYEDGPYDIVFVGYLSTEITQETQDGPPEQSPPAAGGDIASFTLSSERIREGDPKSPPGTLRLNVEGADASVAIENRTPDDPDNGEQALAAFNDTVLLIP